VIADTWGDFSFIGDTVVITFEYCRLFHR